MLHRSRSTGRESLGTVDRRLGVYLAEAHIMRLHLRVGLYGGCSVARLAEASLAIWGGGCVSV
jgi:hypothetical protein